MKKIIKIALAAVGFVLIFSFNISAFDFSAEEPSGLGTEIFNYTADQSNITSYNGEIGTNIYNLSVGGTSYCCKFDTNVMYEFTAPDDGTYTFCITYIARTGNDRGMDYSIDDPEGTKRVFVDLVESDEKMYVTGTFELTKGIHQFYVYAPTGMDDSTLKSCDVYNVAVYFTAPSAPETDVQAADAPVSESPAATAPQTSDTVIGTIAAGVLIAAVFMSVSKKCKSVISSGSDN